MGQLIQGDPSVGLAGSLLGHDLSTSNVGDESRRGRGVGKHSDRSMPNLRVLGVFRLRRDEFPVEIPPGSRRLLAFLAILQQPTMRATVAGALWPGSDERHAFASLRSALVRLHGIALPLVESCPHMLRLTEGVRVDIAHARALARRLIDGEVHLSDIALTSIAPLSLDLLPEWGDDWLTVEAEDWRQLRLHALEALSAVLTLHGQYPAAVAAAIAAVKGDSLRETARLALVKAHLAENNRSEALSEFLGYQDLLHNKLGLQPSFGFVRLIESVKS